MLTGLRAAKENPKSVRKHVNDGTSAVNAGRKPLLKYWFYLDLKSRPVAAKLEASLKELGGNIELFLTPDITHVITDHEQQLQGATTWRSSGFVTNKFVGDESNEQPDVTPTRKRPKTRADAMLERAKDISKVVVTKDPLEEAKCWGITIWTIDKAFRWLDRIKLSIKESVTKRSHKVYELKRSYIKLEAFDRLTRPILQGINNWPRLNFNGSSGDLGIVYHSSVERNMTRKTRSNYPHVNKVLQPGYCEVCRIEYPRLNEHLTSEKHLHFVENESNFLQLDDVIGDTANIDSFLELNNAENTLNECNNIVRDTNMPRTRIASFSDKMKNSPISPAGSESNHKLRSRKQTSNSTNYHGSTADDDGYPVKPEGAKEIRELRSSTRQLLKLVEQASKDTWESGRPKRTCIKQKKISEERSIIDSQTYYKVEIPISKLKSSSPLSKDIDAGTGHQITLQDAVDQVRKNTGLIVKFKKLRTSEVKQLHDEAENFLFPKKEDSSSEEDIDAGGPNTTVSENEGDSTVILSSEPEEETVANHTIVTKLKIDDEGSMDSNCSEMSASRKRKRKTHAEAFILDNQKYYKFETPTSRLRYHGSYLPTFMPSCLKITKHNGDIEVQKNNVTNINNCVQSKTKINDGINIGENVDSDKIKSVVTNVDIRTNELNLILSRKNSDVIDTDLLEESKINRVQSQEQEVGIVKLNDYKFSFEKIPNSEPWYDVFRRQDFGEEYYKSFSEPDFNRPFLLPYQLGSLPSLDPRVCIKAYQETKKYFAEMSSVSSTGGSTPDSRGDDVNPVELHDDDSNNTSVASTCNINNKRKKMMFGSNPRKSPRQHASTLAILSSLIHQRKKKLEQGKQEGISDISKPLPTIQECLEAKSVNVGTKVASQDETSITIDKDIILGGKNDVGDDVDDNVNKAIARDIKNMLDCSLEGLDDLEISIKSDPCIQVFSQFDPIFALECYDREVMVQTNRITTKNAQGKRPGRKKKKNRTGWPNKNRRIKKDIIKQNNLNTVNLVSIDTDSDVDDNFPRKPCNKLKKCGVNHVRSGVSKVNNLNRKVLLYSKTLNSQKTHVKNNVNRVNKCKGTYVSEKSDNVSDRNTSTVSVKNTVDSNVCLQPVVRVQKLGTDVTSKRKRKRRTNSSSPFRTLKKGKPVSPKTSPRVLRKPRGRWYRER